MRSGLSILYLEDDDNDVFFFRDTLYRHSFDGHFQRVENGWQGVRYLLGLEPYKDRVRFPIPNLIVTDLKMPGMNGFEFIRWVRGRAEFRDIPVLILSSSQSERDKAEAEAAGARCYFTKPNNLAQWRQVIRVMLGCGIGLFICGPEHRLAPMMK